MTTILVTGATGNVGSEVVTGLQHRLTGGSVEVRAAVRDPSHLERPLPPEVRTIEYDFLRPETWPAALDGVTTVFLMRPPALSNIGRDMRPAVDHMVASGVRHIVFMSLLGADHNPVVPHAKVESLLEKTGVATTFLRPGFFMQNLSTTHQAEIRDHDEIRIPAGNGRTSFTDVRDIAAVAVETLAGTGHEGKRYALTGSEALTYHQVATVLSDVLGRPIRYTHPSLPGFLLRQHRAGNPWAYALVTTAIYATAALGLADTTTTTVRELLGRDPITLRQFVEDNADAWRRPAPS